MGYSKYFSEIIKGFSAVKNTFTVLITSTLLLSMSAHTVPAAEGSISNYIPGTYGDFAAALEPPTALTLRNDIYYYQGDGDRLSPSGHLQADADLTFLMDFVTLLHKPGIEIFGAQWAYGVFIPIVYADIEAEMRLGNRQRRIQDDTFAIGDITLIPGVLYWKKNNFHFALAEYIVTPTGSYDTNNEINAGLNYWTFDTDLAVTYLNEETGQDYSVNIGYNYNTENTDTDYQTGQEIHVDAMINQFLSETWAIGIHGFYLKQVTGDSGDGAILGSFKGEAAGVGPALLWSTDRLGREVTFIAKWLHEVHTDHRLEGDHFFLSFAMSF